MAKGRHKGSGEIPPAVVDDSELGRRIRNTRLELGLTLKDLEETAELSATHLSEIERGNSSPTLGALIRIAGALGRDTTYFLEKDERGEVFHQPLEACRTFSPAPGITAQILTLGIPGSRVLAYRAMFEAGTPAQLGLQSSDITGEAVYMVWKGVVEADLGESPVRLATGDAVHATCSRPHRLRSIGDVPAMVILVSTHPLDMSSRD